MRAGRLLRFGLGYLRGGVLAGVGLLLTRRCNLRCSYCRVVDVSGDSRRRELAPGEWIRIIDRFRREHRLHFIFTGGEPLLYPDLPALVEHASRHALTSLITNATLLDDSAFRRLRCLDFLTFSMDALEDRSGLLGKGTGLDLAYLGARCREHGITPSAIVTLTARNLDQIEPLVQTLHGHGISSLLSLIHSGVGPWDFRGDAPPALTFRTPEEIDSLSRLAWRLRALKRAGFRLAESDRFLEHLPDAARGTYPRDCPAADPYLTIDVDGRIKACHDTPASTVSALEDFDYPSMLRAVRSTVPPSCRCYYDCYVEARNTPLQNLARVLRRR